MNNAAGGIFVTSQRNRFLNNFAFGKLLDLIDISGGDFNPGVPLCDHNVWFGNTYGRGFPDCTTAGGHQIGSAPAPQANAMTASAFATVVPSTVTAPATPLAPSHRGQGGG